MKVISECCKNTTRKGFGIKSGVKQPGHLFVMPVINNVSLI